MKIMLRNKNDFSINVRTFIHRVLKHRHDKTEPYFERNPQTETLSPKEFTLALFHCSGVVVLVHFFVLFWSTSNPVEVKL